MIEDMTLVKKVKKKLKIFLDPPSISKASNYIFWFHYKEVY